MLVGICVLAKLERYFSTCSSIIIQHDLSSYTVNLSKPKASCSVKKRQAVTFSIEKNWSYEIISCCSLLHMGISSDALNLVNNLFRMLCALSIRSNIHLFSGNSNGRSSLYDLGFTYIINLKLCASVVAFSNYFLERSLFTFFTVTLDLFLVFTACYLEQKCWVTRLTFYKPTLFVLPECCSSA